MFLNVSQTKKEVFSRFLLLSFRKSFQWISIDKMLLFVSDLQCQVWPKTLSPACGGFPAVAKRQLQGRVPWLGEPLSVCFPSCRASTAARNSDGGVRRHSCIYVMHDSRLESLDSDHVVQFISWSAALQLLLQRARQNSVLLQGLDHRVGLLRDRAGHQK